MDKRIKLLNVVLGMDKEVLSRCSSHEINSYVGIAVAILIPMLTGAAAAVLVADYFTHSVFVKALIALAWVVVVWVVERTIAHSLRPGTLGVLAASRIALAILIGIVVSTMVSLVLFRDRIEIELSDKEQRERNLIEESYMAREAELQAEVARYQHRYESIQDSLDHEVQGISGSGHYGHGPAATRLYESMESARVERDEKKREVNDAIQQLGIKKAENLEQLHSKYRHAGLSTSLETLNSLCNPFANGMVMLITRLVVALILIMLETIPLFSICGKSQAEYFLIADQMQESNIRLVEACAEHEQEVKLLENKFKVDIEERKLRFDDLCERIHDLEQTYSKLAEGVHKLTQTHINYTNSSLTENEWDKLDKLYASALSSINCE